MASEENIAELTQEARNIFQLPIPAGLTYQQLLDLLSNHIDTLLKDDFSKLIQILYRLDVSEGKLRYLLQQNKGEMAASIIASLIVERQLQKIETRRQFKKDDQIGDDEKW
jgi:hypothetical protein